jgi:hypothetical protein
MSKNTKKKSVVLPADLLDKMDVFFEKQEKRFFWSGMAFAFLFSLLLFSLKMSEMGDDSGYILRAYKLLKSGDYPSFQGPLYPMFLSLFMAVFGVKIVLFKGLSLVLILLALYFFYKSVAGKIPYSLLIPVFVLTAINSYILYFSSQTFSEAAYLFLQALLFWMLFRKDAAFSKDFDFKSDWKQYLIMGLVLFLGGMTRSVHLGALIAVILFFLIIGKWKSVLASAGGYGVFFILFEVIKRIFWHNSQAQIASQGTQMLLKNPYNAQEGMESFSGYLDRLIDNSQYYISNAFYFITGLRKEGGEVSGFLTLLTYALVFLALFLVFKKNKVLLFNILYVGVLCLVTFIGLQTFWAQWRLIGVFYPFILLTLFSAFYYGLKRFRGLQFLYPLLLIVLLFTGLSGTFGKVKTNLPVLKANLAGDTFADYAPEWKSFMEMNKWSAQNVPAEWNIASRKSEMSFVYTGREFYGVYSVPEVNLDTLKSMIKPNDVVFGVNTMQLIQSQSPVFGQICKDVLCFVQADDNSFVGVYQMDAAKAGQVLSEIKSMGIPVDMNVLQSLQSKAGAGMTLHVTDPERLAQQFVRNKVRYIVLNSPNLFSTLYRYLTYLQLKYPQSLSTVHVIGREPAQTTLVEFRHEQLH